PRALRHGAEPRPRRDRHQAHPLARAQLMPGRELIATALSAAVLIAAWIGLSWGGVVSDLFLPGPDELWAALLDLLDEGYKSRPLWEHIVDSLIRVFAGFGSGALLGTLLGLAMGYFRAIDALAAPFVEFLRPLPQLAYLVLLIIWLGIGETSKITLLFLA